MLFSCGHVNISDIIFNSFDPDFSVDFRIDGKSMTIILNKLETTD